MENLEQVNLRGHAVAPGVHRCGYIILYVSFTCGVRVEYMLSNGLAQCKQYPVRAVIARTLGHHGCLGVSVTRTVVSTRGAIEPLIVVHPH